MQSLYYNFYKQKSEKLAVVSQSAGILAVFYSISISKSASTASIAAFGLQYLQTKKRKQVHITSLTNC